MNTVYGGYFTDYQTEIVLLFACNTVEQAIVEIYKQIKENIFLPSNYEIRSDWDCENDENPCWGTIDIYDNDDKLIFCSFSFETIPYIR